MQKNRVQKLITFSPYLYALVKNKAESFGISFTEYLRLLAVNDIKEETKNIPLVNSEMEKQIGENLKALKKDKYSIVRNSEELERHLKNL